LACEGGKDARATWENLNKKKKKKKWKKIQFVSIYCRMKSFNWSVRIWREGAGGEVNCSLSVSSVDKWGWLNRVRINHSNGDEPCKPSNLERNSATANFASMRTLRQSIPTVNFHWDNFLPGLIFWPE
jgi:hypothetical protein